MPSHCSRGFQTPVRAHEITHCYPPPVPHASVSMEIVRWFQRYYLRRLSPTPPREIRESILSVITPFANHNQDVAAYLKSGIMRSVTTKWHANGIETELRRSFEKLQLQALNQQKAASPFESILQLTFSLAHTHTYINTFKKIYNWKYC